MKSKLIIIGIVLLCITLLIVVGVLFGKYQMSKIPALSFEETLQYATKNKDDAVITVGIIKDGKKSFNVYGRDGRELESKRHVYDIGSVTKTFTASLICKAVNENKINLDDTIDRYLDLPKGEVYPTIGQLVTHTSGYKGYYFETPMISNFFQGKNDFYGIDREMMLNRLENVKLKNKEYPFNYSNFGYAVLGMILEEVYGENYTTLMNSYLHDELGLKNTKISDKSGDLKNYWDWSNNDVYLAAGGIISDIDDMLAYAEMQLEGYSYFEQCQKSLAEINVSQSGYKAMGINTDAIGMSWIIDNENGFIWHNGGTDDYNCYIGFCPKTQTAVVILSNLSPGEKIPATVSGIKLLQSLQ